MTTPKFIAGAVEYFESGQADPLFCTAGVAATGPDKLVLATIVHSNGYPAKTISQVKFGNNGSNMTAGVAMTQVPSGTVADDSVGLRTSMYYLAVGDAPITASQSASGVAVDLNAVADENAILVRVYERVDQTTPTGTATAQHTDNATSYSANVASVAGDLVVDGLYVWDGTTSASAPTQGAGQTKILNDTVEGLTGLTFVASEEVATGTTTTMSWTGYSAISAGSTHVGVALKGNGLIYAPSYSRDFNGSTQYGSSTSIPTIPTSGYYVCASFWFYPDTTGGTGDWIPFYLYDSTNTPRLGCYIPTGTLTVKVEVGDTGFKEAAASNAAVAGQWNHIAFLYHDADNTTTVVVNGNWANRGVIATGPGTLTGAPTKIYLGCGLETGSPDYYADGKFAHVALWVGGGALLTQSEVESLAAGASPRTINRANLKAYWPLNGEASPEPDWVGTYDLTLTGSPTQYAGGPSVESPVVIGARDFNGSTQYASITSCPVSDVPFTIAGWFYIATNPATTYHLASVSCASQSNGYFQIYIDASDGDRLKMFLYKTSYYTCQVTGVSPVPYTTWHHFAAVVSGANSRRIILNGDWAGSGTHTSSIPLGASLTDTCLAGPVLGTTGTLDGALAHVAVWNSALSQADVEALAAGAHPLNIGSPVAYWPLSGLASPEPDDVASYDLTLTGSPAAYAYGPYLDAIDTGGSILPMVWYYANNMGD